MEGERRSLKYVNLDRRRGATEQVVVRNGTTILRGRYKDGRGQATAFVGGDGRAKKDKREPAIGNEIGELDQAMAWSPYILAYLTLRY
jgi:hypothetical protein